MKRNSTTRFGNVLPPSSSNHNQNNNNNLFAPQHVVVDAKDHPIHSPRNSKKTTLQWLPLINFMWLTILSIALLVYVLIPTEKNTTTVMEPTTNNKSVVQHLEVQKRFTFVPDDQGLLIMHVYLQDIALDQLLYYHVCCKKENDLVCRLGNSRNLGIDAIVSMEQQKKGTSLNHQSKRIVVRVVADHPSMTGAACWITYKNKG